MAKENCPRQRTTIHDIPGDILGIILQHITSPAALVHAAATCKLWRRVIGSAGFLRRFRRRNGPHILGHYHYSEGEHGRTDFFPFPAPAGEIAVDDDTVTERTCLHFLTTSYSYLNSAELHDSSGGLLAFHRFGVSIILVCNPWTRQHREIYPPSMLRSANTDTLFHGIYLLDADPAGDTGTDLNMSNFRVLCLRLIRSIHDGSKTIEASVFSARDEHWLELSNMAIGNDIVPGAYVVGPPFVLVGRAGGSICWRTRIPNVILHLDEGTGKFAVFTLPVHAGVNMNPLSYNRTNLRVIGGDTGTVHLVRIVGGDIEVLRYALGDGGACVVERRVPVLPVVASRNEVRERRPWLWCFVDRADEVAAHGSIALCDILCDAEFVRKFAADVKNLKLGRVKRRSDGGRSFPYELPWTISVCV